MGFEISHIECVHICLCFFTVRPEKFLKSPGQKTREKSNKSISRIIFLDQIPFFAISKMAKNQFLNWVKV